MEIESKELPCTSYCCRKKKRIKKPGDFFGLPLQCVIYLSLPIAVQTVAKSINKKLR